MRTNGSGTTDARPRRQSGFTLIELLVVIALVAVMMALAAPSFVKFLRNSQLTSTANSFVASMAAARSEATKRNRSAYVVPAVQATGWSSGWRVFVDTNNTGLTYDPANDLLVLDVQTLPTSVNLVTTNGATGFDDGTGAKYIRFDGSGFPRKAGINAAFIAGSIDFESNGEIRRVILSPSGRMKVCTTTTNCD